MTMQRWRTPGAFAGLLGLSMGCSPNSNSSSVAEQMLAEKRSEVGPGSCDQADHCIDGDTETDAPCADSWGVGTRVCEDGRWSTSACVCLSESQEYDALADACLLPIACDAEASPFGGGDGESAPYLICSPAHLEQVMTAPSSRFLLARSLDLSGIDDFVPLGAPSAASPGEFEAFSGEFYGAGRALVGLVIDRSSEALGSAENHTGLFHRLFEATVVDLELHDFTVRGGTRVGTLAGEAVYASIERVAVSAGAVTGEGDDVGGLLGRADHSDIEQVSASTAVTGLSAVGGLVGFTYGNSFHRSRAHGAVTALASNAGGLIGRTNEDAVLECAATGPVTGTGRVGGLIGYSSGDDAIVHNLASGPVGGETSVGGLIGAMGGFLTRLEASYALGAVTGTTEKIGGLVGFNGDPYDHSISDCYAFGVVGWQGAGAPPATVGAALGYGNLSVVRTMARAQDPALPLVGEFGPAGRAQDSQLLPAGDFADEASFPSWDFDDVWFMSSAAGRPVLRWELEE